MVQKWQRREIMSKKNAGKVNAELDKALALELKEIGRKHPHDGDGYKKGDYIYNTVERMRVYDRALKLEAIKLKANDSEWGSAFNDEPEKDDEE